MKKTIIALAIASSVGVSQAESNTTLYGSIRLSVEYNSTNDLADGGGVVDVVNQSSRFGIKGSEDLGNGLSVIYKYEFGVDAAVADIRDNDRLSYVGLTGSFGTFTIGQQYSPIYNVLGYNDTFNGSSAFSLYPGPERLGNMVAYFSPTYGGFSAQAAIITDGEGEVGDGHLSNSNYSDAYNLAVLWKANGFTAGATYLETNGTGNALKKKLAGGLVGYENDAFRLGFGFVDSIEDDGENDLYYYELNGEYYPAENNVIRASVSAQDSQADGVDTRYLYQVGYEYQFSKRTLAWVEYAYTDNGDSIDNNNLVSVGLRTDF